MYQCQILAQLEISLPRLLLAAVALGVVPLLCEWLARATKLAPLPYHRCLVKHVISMLVGVAKFTPHGQEVAESISLDDLNTHLLSSEEVHTCLVEFYCF